MSDLIAFNLTTGRTVRVQAAGHRLREANKPPAC
jgi:hypothetical protein